MKTKPYDLAVLIGRFQPFHIGHLENLTHAIENCSDNILVIVGSSFQPRTIKNPFTFEERKNMILATAQQIAPDATVTVVPQRDFLYEDNKWVTEIQEKISTQTEHNSDKKVCIVGHDKDESTYYLSMFPRYDVVDPGKFVCIGDHEINATQIRELLFTRGTVFTKSAVPESTYQIISDFVNSENYVQLIKEYEFIQGYKKQWENSPYPPTFMTVDGVVVQGGHILLVKRKAEPGRGLWALPGGFVDPDETLEQAVIRELKEETRISVPVPIIRSSITHRRQFDHPKRSLRGRTFSEAFLIELPLDHNNKLARVKGADDAEKAQWVPISDALNMSEQLFEDHHSIISMLVARAK